MNSQGRFSTESKVLQLVIPVLAVAQLFHRFSYTMDVVITLPLVVDVFHFSLPKVTPHIKLAIKPIKNPTNSKALDMVANNKE